MPDEMEDMRRLAQSSLQRGIGWLDVYDSPDWPYRRRHPDSPIPRAVSRAASRWARRSPPSAAGCPPRAGEQRRILAARAPARDPDQGKPAPLSAIVQIFPRHRHEGGKLGKEAQAYAVLPGACQRLALAQRLQHPAGEECIEEKVTTLLQPLC